MSLVKRPKRPYTGASVRGGRLIYSSVSQVVLFDPETEGCHRKWAFQYVFNKKLKQTDAQTGGVDYAGSLEHWFKTGEDVLPEVLQNARKFFPARGPDLRVEQPLCVDTIDPASGAVFYMGGLLQAIELRQRFLREPSPQVRQEMLVSMRQYAGLLAAGIPLDGAPDFQHERGEYVDEDGVLRREHPAALVVETGDLKTTSRIDPHKIKKGQNAGMILPGRAKTAAQICDHVQMLGYSVDRAYKNPPLTHFRMSHVYAQTEGKKAVKRTGIISRDELLRRWAKKEDVVRRMDQVAGAEKIEDVQPNVSACDAYTHVDPVDGKTTLPGCGHRYYCPLSTVQISQHILGYQPQEHQAMSLFDQINLPTNGVSIAPAAPAPLPTEAEHAAAVAAEKAKLLAQLETAKPVAHPSWPAQEPVTSLTFGFCASCGAALNAENASRPPNGPTKHIGCPVSAAAPAPPAPPAVAPPPPPTYGPLSPPDAPALDPIASADPLPPEVIATLTDPTLKDRVEKHAAEHAARAAAEAEEKAKADGTHVVWCPASNRRIQLDVEMALARKMTCECGKEIKLKPAKEEGGYFATISKHKPPKAEEAVAPPPPPAQAAPAPPVPASTSDRQGELAANLAQAQHRATNQNGVGAAELVVAPPPPPLAAVVAPPPPSSLAPPAPSAPPTTVTDALFGPSLGVPPPPMQPSFLEGAAKIRAAADVLHELADWLQQQGG